MDKSKPYGIGLDIGTNSVGFVATDAEGHLIRLKGKTVIGAYLFNAGISAAERRGFRTTRRRLSRVKWRLRLLREVFETHFQESMGENEDNDFFLRFKYSNISPKDPQFSTAKGLFNDRTDKEFYDQYPTIYHLRRALMTENRQFDIREIYIAMHHIVKYRGHFLKEGRAKDFKVGDLRLLDNFKMMNEQIDEINPLWQLKLPTDDASIESITAILLDNTQSQNDRQKAVTKVILATLVKASDKDINAARKRFVGELSKAMVGLKTKLWVLADVSQNGDWEIKYENYADFAETIGSGESDTIQSLFNEINDLYGVITLAGIIPKEAESFSDGMVRKYEHHRKNLDLLKAYCAEQSDGKRGRQIRQTYDNYIDGVDSKQFTQEDFYKALSKFTAKDEATSENAKLIAQEIAVGTFMPKLRTKANGTIPHQLHQKELDAIIENQKKYYPWLGEVNPVESHRRALPYKLDELVSFRIPYYVGPMVTPTKGDPEKSKFAWMVRKEPGTITPWNFDQKVDRSASGEAFIQRMKTTDTFLIGEDVLPQQSLLYQKFEVLNELNKIMINGKPICREQKQRLFKQLFMQYKTVTVKKVQQNLIANGEESENVPITGLSDPLRFNSSFSTYIDYKDILGTDAVNDSAKQSDIEQIIAWSTIFEDAAIFREKLNDISWLNDDQRNKLSQKRYRGWGRHSRKLLAGLRDGEGQTIIERLWNTNDNFMQIQNDSEIARQITEANSSKMATAEGTDEIIDGFYTSPENKKALREVMKVVKDIQRAHHGQAPAWVYIESPREAPRPGQRTVSREQQLTDLYEGAAKEIVDDAISSELKDKIKSKAKFSDRLVLYFLQNGRDLYTGEPLSIDNLSSYDIDHILPQSLIKDDSIDNRVLVHSAVNRDKNALFASDLFMGKMGKLWNQWHRQGLISSRKLQHLMMRPDQIDKFATGFVARQLTETRQVIRLTANVLSNLYQKNDTKIVMIKAGLNSEFRKIFDFPKNRNVNDYHHAFDALLTAKIGRYLLARYPRLEPFFVYGDFVKNSDAMKRLRSFDFVGQLATKQTNGQKQLVDQRDLENVKLANKDTGEIVWDKAAELKELDHVYNFKTMLIQHAMEQQHGAMFQQTVYKASENGRKKLIPIKQGKPTDIYGGYSKGTTAYLAIVWIESLKKYRVLSVDTSQADMVQKLRQKSEKFANEYLQRVFLTYLNNESKKQFDSADIRLVVPKMLMDQVVQDEGMLFAIGTTNYYHNLQQLFLSRKDQLILSATEPNSDEFNVVIEHIFGQISEYFKLYDVNKLRQSLVEKKKLIEGLPIEDVGENIGRKSVIIRTLIGLHANKSFGDLKPIGIKTLFGKMNRSKMFLSHDAKLIYTSPSGLFTRTVPLSSL